MDIDLHSKAVHLLNEIANSIYDREPKDTNVICFNTTEVHLVEKWLGDFVKETVQ